MPGEKTEKPTEHKKKQARKEGTVARSPDVGAWAGMAAASVLLPWTIELAMDRARGLMERVPWIVENPDPARALGLLSDSLLAIGVAVAPLAFGLLVLGIAAAAAQGGVRVASKLFIPKFSRLSPLKGIKRTMGPQALWEAVKALVKTAVLGAVLYLAVQDLVPILLGSGSLPLTAVVGAVTDASISLIRAAAVAGLVMAAADYFVVRRRTDKQLRMSKQDVKDEYKKTEGDPLVKAQIRQKQTEMSRNRMMADVPQADAVLVNPTHVAVALRYDPAKGAPRVVAKGAGAVATKIREAATEHRIPLVQDVPLARALYAACDIGTEIPPDFYAAVAKVLAFVMSLKAKGSAAGTHRPPTPSV
ncbi:MAG TPA: EscU/YscU/HrcU family type III secretion system export apparatus switch protein, partial [Pilimelia sp.]|nr:EscU/YscU/HrcU family type III secretion system export apparatus switch protein [Pilimelia sp.]